VQVKMLKKGTEGGMMVIEPSFVKITTIRCGCISLLEANFGSRCDWRYLEQSPDAWRVRLGIFRAAEGTLEIP
jgi:hypothetical protein